MNERPKPTLVPIGVTPLTDIPLQLRRYADRIEAGEKVEKMIIVAATPDGQIITSGYGNTGKMDAEIGLLFAAAIKLAIL